MKREMLVKIDLPAAITLEGDLTIVRGSTAIVLFAHGSGSSRLSRRNRYVAKELQKGDLSTLLLDLLTEKEERIDSGTGHLRFDIDFLAERLIAAANFLKNTPETSHLNIGLFGASTGGGAALVAAARKPEWIKAAVSRGGRPDLASDLLPLVQAPTLLIVGENDPAVIHLNEDAYMKLTCEKKFEIVDGATHLFEEPGALEQVAALARSWFQTKLNS
jgi:putative phosphoribosyl transferase